MTQREWVVQVVVRASSEEVRAIGERMTEVICVPADHEGVCLTPWTMMTSLVADHEEPQRSELLALLDEE